jgi:anti-anti-sigma factor
LGPFATVPSLRGDKIPVVGVNGEHFRIDLRSEPDKVVLELHGELDLLGAPMLQEHMEKVEAQAPAIVVLDLQDLQFVDSGCV